MDQYSLLRVIGPKGSVPGGIALNLQVRDILYMIVKVQTSICWQIG